MASENPATPLPGILIVGASRGLGHAMAAEFLAKNWRVTATLRDPQRRTPLHDLAEKHGNQLVIEQLDITIPDQLDALHTRLSGRIFTMLFVNAGTTNPDPTQTIGQVSTQDFVDLMITNALSPMRVIEALADNVASDGLIGVMSSGQGSIANNETGQRELYRGTKAALNMFMRSFAARQAGTPRALAVVAPGWIKTDLGGPDAPLTIEQSIPSLVTVLIEKQRRPGLEYLDYRGRTVPW